MEANRVAEVTIDVHDGVPDEPAAVVDNGLDAFNQAAAPLGDVQGLSAFARDAHGRVIGGVVARTWGECCEVRELWVNEAFRRQGVARRVMSEVEAKARSRGCRRIYLDTFTFQAPALYQKLGYNTLARIDGFTPGIAKLLMLKELV